MKIILLGPPGSGKGTISERLAKDYRLFHISPGELLREEVNKKTALGREISKFINKGKLVPYKFVAEMVRLEVKDKKNYILDGFPRSLRQAKQMTDLGINKVILLDVSEKDVIERLSGRRVCAKGEHNFHIKYIPPKRKGICDFDGTKLIQRKDDRPNVIKQRFKIYHKETEPVVRYFKRKGILAAVNAAQQPDDVYAEVRKVLGTPKNR
ncbi:MAG: nucleoside monophosphate kinase [Nanoarchaeota archaeon]